MTATESRAATRVLIYEPHPEVRSFLVRLVEHLGYEPALCESDSAPEGDVLLLDTSSADAVALALALRRANPLLPLVCAGHELPSPDVLALEPVAFLVKPFTVAECEQALAQAVALAPARMSM